jgi:hypothetical protein
MQKQLEKNNLYKGIFWIKNLQDYYDNELYFRIPINSNGDVIYTEGLNLNSKDGNNYNHKATWRMLSKSETEGHKFDYYPRGRVEVNHGRAIIYANSNICDEKLKQWVMDKFHLNKQNGILKVTIKPDNSEHYKCFLDR